MRSIIFKGKARRSPLRQLSVGLSDESCRVAQAAEAEAPPEAWEEMAGAMLCWKKWSSSGCAKSLPSIE